ncbi:MAG: hypothetical protein ABSA04_13240 [Desulfobaccales bacterium]|jgi:hypothetical protein
MVIATSFSLEKKVDDDLGNYLPSIIFLLRTVASYIAGAMGREKGRAVADPAFLCAKKEWLLSSS